MQEGKKGGSTLLLLLSLALPAYCTSSAITVVHSTLCVFWKEGKREGAGMVPVRVRLHCVTKPYHYKMHDCLITLLLVMMC